MEMDILTQPFVSSDVKQRKGPGGKMLSYIDTPLVIERLNAAFAGDWSFRIVSHEVTEAEVVVLAELEAGGIVKQQFGSKQRENNVPLGDTAKAAASDSLKKCATLLGVGLELYTKDTNSHTENGNGHQANGDGELTEAQKLLRERRRRAA